MKYTYKKTEKILTSIIYLQGQHPIIAGMTRTIKIDGHRFENMPVYSLGGKSLVALSKSYVEIQPDKSISIGRHNIKKIGKLLCNKSKLCT